MKKKLAFMLASVMLLSVFVLPTQVSAAIVAELRGNSAFAVATNTVLYEFGVAGETGMVRRSNTTENSSTRRVNNRDDSAIYVVDGQYLQLNVQDHVYAGTKLFSLELDGAQFLFGNGRHDLTQAEYAKTISAATTSTAQRRDTAYTKYDSYVPEATINSLGLANLSKVTAAAVNPRVGDNGTLLPDTKVAGRTNGDLSAKMPTSSEAGLQDTYMTTRGMYFGGYGVGIPYYEDAYIRYPKDSFTMQQFEAHFKGTGDAHPVVEVPGIIPGATVNTDNFFVDVPGGYDTYTNVYGGSGNGSLYMYDNSSKLGLELLIMDSIQGEPIITIFNADLEIIGYSNLSWADASNSLNPMVFEDLIEEPAMRRSTYSYFTQLKRDIEGDTPQADGMEIPYALRMEGASRASVEILPIVSPYTGIVLQNSYNFNDYSNGTLPSTSGGYYANLKLRVPLALVATADDVRLRVVDTNMSVTHSNVYLIGTTVSGGTSTAIFDNSVSRYTAGTGLRIRENRIGSINTDKEGVITLTAPYGWYFEMPARDSNFGLTLQGGLTWNTAGWQWNGTTGKYSLKYFNDNSATTVSGVDKSIETPVFKVRFGPLNVWSNNANSWVESYTDTTKLQVVVAAGKINRSTNVVGTVLLEGVKLIPYEYASFDNVTLSMTTSNLGMSDATLDLGSRANWNVDFTAATPTKELVSGRYDAANPTSTIHEGSKVTIAEKASNAWWASRETVIALDDVAKFRAVTIHSLSSSNITPESIATTYYTIPTASRINRNGNVYLEPNKLTLYNLSIASGKTGTLSFTPYISIRADHSGEIKLHFYNTTEGATVVNSSGPSCVIANAIKPINVTAESSDIKIGYQTLSVKDITIEENRPGTLVENTQILVSISDMITEDLFFANVNPAADVEVNTAESSLALKNIANISNSNVSNVGGVYAFSSIGTSVSPLILGGGTISMEIARRSINVPAKITLKNLLVKVSRDVPQSVVDYNAIIWGNAIAANYGNLTDQFSSIPGIIQEHYVSVVSAANDKTSVLSQQVTISIGDNYCVVNGVITDFAGFDTMDAVAYISPATQAFMVPLRFVSYAFGISMDQILWDNTTKTATIIHPTRIIQFTADSERMMLNGAPVTMDYTHLGAGVYKAEIEANSSRMFIPFRAVGDAFGVEVEWIAETSTAVFKPSVDPMS